MKNYKVKRGDTLFDIIRAGSDSSLSDAEILKRTKKYAASMGRDPNKLYAGETLSNLPDLFDESQTSTYNPKGFSVPGEEPPPTKPGKLLPRPMPMANEQKVNPQDLEQTPGIGDYLSAPGNYLRGKIDQHMMGGPEQTWQGALRGQGNNDQFYSKLQKDYPAATGIAEGMMWPVGAGLGAVNAGLNAYHEARAGGDFSLENLGKNFNQGFEDAGKSFMGMATDPLNYAVPAVGGLAAKAVKGLGRAAPALEAAGPAMRDAEFFPGAAAPRNPKAPNYFSDEALNMPAGHSMETPPMNILPDERSISLQQTPRPFDVPGAEPAPPASAGIRTGTMAARPGAMAASPENSVAGFQNGPWPRTARPRGPVPDYWSEQATAMPGSRGPSLLNNDPQLNFQDPSLSAGPAPSQSMVREGLQSAAGIPGESPSAFANTKISDTVASPGGGGMMEAFARVPSVGRAELPAPMSKALQAKLPPPPGMSLEQNMLWSQMTPDEQIWALELLKKKGGQ